MNRTTWLCTLLPFAVLACSKSTTEKAPPAAKAVETAPAAPTPAAPTPAAPKAAQKGGPADALAIMKLLAEKHVVIDTHLDRTANFAWVDYSTTPQGRSQHVEKSICGLDQIDDFEKLPAKLYDYAGQIASAFANDAISCDPAGAATINCGVSATEEGEASLTFQFTTSLGAPRLIGFAKRETFMIDNDARLAKDRSDRDAAFTKLAAAECVPAAARGRTGDNGMIVPSADAYCCCTAPKLDAAGEGLMKSECTSMGGTCLATATERCSQDIADHMKSMAN